jgi:hypothetical protein
MINLISNCKTSCYSNIKHVGHHQRPLTSTSHSTHLHNLHILTEHILERRPRQMFPPPPATQTFPFSWCNSATPCRPVSSKHLICLFPQTHLFKSLFHVNSTSTVLCWPSLSTMKKNNNPPLQTTPLNTWADRVKVTNSSTRFSLDPLPRQPPGSQLQISEEMLENTEQWHRCMVGFFLGFKMHTIQSIP